jgi:RNA polymerase sigma-70 factor (ECF subfamily)
VRRVRAGEAALFELLMRRYNQRVYRAIRSLLRDEGEVEDAMQQAWLAAYAHLDQFEGASSFSTWLTRIALNQGLARLRRRARHARVAAVPAKELDHMRHPSVGPEERAGDRELARMVEEAVDALPEKYRSAFILREIEGLSTADAAACLEISEELMKVRLHRARLALRDSLFTRAGAVAATSFPFMGVRCDRVVSQAMDAILRQSGSP